MSNPVVVVRDVWRAAPGVDVITDDSPTVPDGRALWMWCPGCDSAHRVAIPGEDGSRPEHGDVWDWDGNLEQPTISPSILCHTSVHLCPPAYEHYEACPDPGRCGERAHAVLADPDDGPRVLGHRKPCIASPSWGSCHSFVRAGFWVFLDDTAHALAGRTVAMVPLPDWLVR